MALKTAMFSNWMGCGQQGASEDSNYMQVQYSLQAESFKGFVDLGDGPDEQNVASAALMFMVVGLQGH